MRSKLTYVILPIASGVLTGLPLLYNEAAPLAYVAMIPYFAVLLKCTEKQVKSAVFFSFLFGLSYKLTAFGWISQMHPLSFTGMSRTASFFVCYGGALLLSLLFSLPLMLFGFLFRLACGSNVIKRRGFLLIPLAASLWALLEAAQEIGSLAVPWARLAVGQAGYGVLIGSAGVFGCLFVGAVIVAVNVSLTLLLFGKSKREKAVFASVAAIVLLLSVTLSLVAHLGIKEEKTVDIAVIQGNIPTNEKWEDPAISVETYVSMLEALDGNAPDIVFLPETAVTFDVTQAPAYLSRIKAFAYKNGCTVLFGTYRFDEKGRCFNTVREANASGLIGNFYAKQRLVPFGEYLPCEEFFDRYLPDVSKLELFSERLNPGDGVCVFEIGDAKTGALICFDSLFPSLSRDSVAAGADLMFIATNDGWFSDTVAVKIHNSAAKVRSVETGRCYVRAANTGISSVIYPTGEQLYTLPANERGIIRCEVPLLTGYTLYVKTGDLFTYACVIFAAAFYCCAAITYFTSKKKRGHDK